MLILFAFHGKKGIDVKFVYSHEKRGKPKVIFDWAKSIFSKNNVLAVVQGIHTHQIFGCLYVCYDQKLMWGMPHKNKTYSL